MKNRDCQTGLAEPRRVSESWGCVCGRRAAGVGAEGGRAACANRSRASGRGDATRGHRFDPPQAPAAGHPRLTPLTPPQPRAAAAAAAAGGSWRWRPGGGAERGGRAEVSPLPGGICAGGGRGDGGSGGCDEGRWLPK